MYGGVTNSFNSEAFSATHSITGTIHNRDQLGLTSFVVLLFLHPGLGKTIETRDEL